MRLIDAEFTKRLAERLIKDEEYYNTSPKSWAEEIENFKCLIDSIPTIEAKPVVHAHWKKDPITGWKYCSECQEDAPYSKYLDDTYRSRFCPACGAQMDEVVEEIATTTDHIADIGKKEPICGGAQNGVKIPVISMADVPKIVEAMENEKADS